MASLAPPLSATVNPLFAAAVARRERLYIRRCHVLGIKALHRPVDLDAGTAPDANEQDGVDAVDDANATATDRDELELLRHYIELTRTRTVDAMAAEILDEWKAVVQQRQGDVLPTDASELGPKKANLDLRRALDKRLEPLEDRTKRAVAELIRRRVGETGRAAPVTNGSR